MASFMSIALILPLVPVLLYSQSALFWRLAGRVDVDVSKIVRWENNTGLNNAECKVDYTANACEDVKIHYDSQTAFLACGNPIERSHWYPCADIHTVHLRAEDSFQEQLFKHDLKTGHTTELKLEGWQGDFITHGIEIFQLPADTSKIHIFAVNHARSGDSIAIFEHKLGTDVAKLVKNVKHANIKTANGVAATGPLSFYFTNDHYFANGIPRTLESKFGPWSWATHVQHCDANGETVICKQVTGTFAGANGINLWKDRLFMGDLWNASVKIFEIHEDKSLTQLQTVPLGASPDNINIIPTTGDPLVAVFPKPLDIHLYIENVERLGKELLVPTAALRLNHEKNYEPEVIFFDDGPSTNFMTAAAADPYNGILIGANILQYGGFAVCKVPKSIFK